VWGLGARLRVGAGRLFAVLGPLDQGVNAARACARSILARPRLYTLLLRPLVMQRVAQMIACAAGRFQRITIALKVKRAFFGRAVALCADVLVRSGSPQGSRLISS